MDDRSRARSASRCGPDRAAALVRAAAAGVGTPPLMVKPVRSMTTWVARRPDPDGVATEHDAGGDDREVGDGLLRGPVEGGISGRSPGGYAVRKPAAADPVTVTFRWAAGTSRSSSSTVTSTSSQAPGTVERQHRTGSRTSGRSAPGLQTSGCRAAGPASATRTAWAGRPGRCRWPGRWWHGPQSCPPHDRPELGVGDLPQFELAGEVGGERLQVEAGSVAVLQSQRRLRPVADGQRRRRVGGNGSAATSGSPSAACAGSAEPAITRPAAAPVARTPPRSSRRRLATRSKAWSAACPAVPGAPASGPGRAGHGGSSAWIGRR